MIVALRGCLAHWDERASTVWLDVQGVTYEVLIPAFAADWVSARAAGEELRLFTYYHVSERNPTPVLIGFQHQVERDFFRKFIEVPDVGPTKAVRALTHPVPEIARWIEAQDAKALQALPGIGARLSQTIVATLSGKLLQEALLRPEAAEGDGPGEVAPDLREDAVAALTSLQYTAREADQLVVEALRARPAIRLARGAPARRARTAGAGLMPLPRREQWLLWTGALLAVAFVLVFGALGVGRESGLWTASVLHVRVGVWGVAVTILALFLALQLALQGRGSLQRERRLVQTAAALREATAQLERLATTDPLTTMMNRRAFFDRYGVEFRRSMRYGRPLALVMIDLDDFKDVNDRWGHPFGDFMLAELARVVTSNVRESDVVARYGGEEFVLLLPETTVEAAALVAEKLRAAVDAHEFRSEGLPPRGQPAVHVSVSAGVSALPSATPVDGDELISRADRALYRAKRSGKNQVVIDDGRPASLASGDGG